MISCNVPGAIGAVLWAAHATAALPPLIPQPKEVVEHEGTLALQLPLRIEGAQLSPAATAVLERAFGPRAERGTPVQLGTFDDGPGLLAQAYQLRVTTDNVEILAPTDGGLFYGAHTLRQLAEGTGNKLPLCEINDWPSMRWRGVDYPVTGPEDLQRLAGLKLNLVVWEVSGAYVSPSHPELGGTMPLDEIAAICAEARRNHITLVLEVQSFGHAHWLLGPHPEFRADPESTHTIRPFMPEAYELLADVYGELIEASGVPWFFPGCDEPWQIDKWCEDQGLDPPEVVGKHLARLSDIASEHGARIMVWGDYLLRYPDSLQYLDPERVVIVDWHYDTRDEYPSVDTFVNAGFETLVAPSVCPWEPIFPAYHASAPNVINLVADGHRRGAIGLLNTNWPTGPMPIEALWYGWALGAEASWSAEPVDRNEFDQRFFGYYFALPPERIADQYWSLAALNDYWPSAQAADRPPGEILAEIAARYAQKVVPLKGPFFDMHWGAYGQLQITEDARLALAQRGEATGDGWRQLETVANRADSVFAPLQRAAWLALAYRGLHSAASARARGDEQACSEALEGGLPAFTMLGTLAEQQGDEETELLLTETLERLDAAREGGEFSAAEVFGIPEPEHSEGPVEFEPAQSFLPVETQAARPTARGPSLVFPQAGGAAEIPFEVLEPGTYRIWGLLRHSAGVWEGDQFVRGGRNAAYEGNYAWQLDGEPLAEEWLGEELNPDDDEAMQWAVIYDGHLDEGEHTLRMQPQVTNWAIAARLIFADDPDWEPPAEM